MEQHYATIAWKRTSADFTYASYNRAHEWSFTAVTVPASSAVAFKGTAERVNPEEAFVAALSSCHMLTFLAVAAKNAGRSIPMTMPPSAIWRRTSPASSRSPA